MRSYAARSLLISRSRRRAATSEVGHPIKTSISAAGWLTWPSSMHSLSRFTCRPFPWEGCGAWNDPHRVGVGFPMIRGLGTGGALRMIPREGSLES